MLTFAKMKRTYFLITLTLVLSLVARSQIYPNKDFGAPLSIPIQLNGNFGELRPNHFHTGFDFSTQGKEGQSVMAVCDGYISRIKISPYGYGKALYITHPNGYTSVYGHLKSYNKEKVGEIIIIIIIIIER